MTEAEWLADTNPAYLMRKVRSHPWRKRCLYICASWAGVRDLLTSEGSRSALELLEDLGEAEPPYHTFESVEETYYAIAMVESEGAWHTPFTADGNRVRAADLAVGAAGDNDDGEAEEEWHLVAGELEAASELACSAWSELGRGLCHLVRDVFGNPFRSAPVVAPAWLMWQDGIVSRLAGAAYEDGRSPEGTLDPARLAVLADALEDAGCTDAEPLGHLRSPGPHVRACWLSGPCHRLVFCSCFAFS